MRHSDLYVFAEFDKHRNGSPLQTPPPILEAGVAHHRAGNLAAAEKAYKEAIAALPGDPNPYHLLGIIADQTGHPRAALDLFSAAITMQPQHVFFETQGSFLARQGDKIGACRDFLAALALSRTSDSAVSGLLEAQPDFGEAIEPILHVPPSAGSGLSQFGAEPISLEGYAAAAAILAGRVNAFCVRRGIDRHRPAANAATLREEGAAVLGTLLDPVQIAEIRHHLAGRPVYNMHTHAHSDGVLRPIDGEARRYHFGSYDLATTLVVPHLLELANRPEVVALAESYLDCVPTIYGMYLWWSFGGHPGIGPSNNELHRDADDVRFCTLFVYLTNVDEETGPHVFIRRTHSAQALAGLIASGVPERVEEGDLRQLTCTPAYVNDRLYEWAFHQHFLTLVGPAGTAAMIDTNGLHKGALPKSRDRLILMVRYGFGRTRTYVENRLAPLPRASVGNRLEWSVKTRYLNRLLLD